MRNKYKIVLFTKFDGSFELYFNCTRSQVDKVFNSLAFAAFGSSIDSCILFQCGRTPRNVAIFNNDVELNRFVVKSVEVTNV